MSTALFIQAVKQAAGGARSVRRLEATNDYDRRVLEQRRQRGQSTAHLESQIAGRERRLAEMRDANERRAARASEGRAWVRGFYRTVNGRRVWVAGHYR